MESFDEELAPRGPSKFARSVQWAAFAYAAVIAAVAWALLTKAAIPGFPFAVVYGLIGIATLIAIGAAPIVFWRLSDLAKLGIYIALFLVTVLLGSAGDMIGKAYRATPQGRAEAATRAKEQDQETAERMAKAAAQRTHDRVAERRAWEEEQDRKLRSCFGILRRRVKSLEKRVQDSLDNPRSFEHVETAMIAKAYKGRNVTMTFRAENAFGAIRTATVDARVNPENCEVEEMGAFESD